MIKEHEKEFYSKNDENDLRKYIKRILQRFFEIENTNSKLSKEAMMVETLRRYKEYCKTKCKDWVIALNGLTGGVYLSAMVLGGEQKFSKNTAFNKDFGDQEDTVCEGNDPRLSDARQPLPHTHLMSDIENINDLLESYGIPTASEAHSHLNNDVLNKIRYNGTKEEIDLAYLEMFVTSVRDLIQSLLSVIDSLNELCDEKKQIITTMLLPVIERIADVEDNINVFIDWSIEGEEYCRDKAIEWYWDTIYFLKNIYLLAEDVEPITDNIMSGIKLICDGEIPVELGSPPAISRIETIVNDPKIYEHCLNHGGAQNNLANFFENDDFVWESECSIWKNDIDRLYKIDVDDTNDIEEYFRPPLSEYLNGRVYSWYYCPSENIDFSNFDLELRFYMTLMRQEYYDALMAERPDLFGTHFYSSNILYPVKSNDYSIHFYFYTQVYLESNEYVQEIGVCNSCGTNPEEMKVTYKVNPHAGFAFIVAACDDGTTLSAYVSYNPDKSLSVKLVENLDFTSSIAYGDAVTPIGGNVLSESTVYDTPLYNDSSYESATFYEDYVHMAVNRTPDRVDVYISEHTSGGYVSLSSPFPINNGEITLPNTPTLSYPLTGTKFAESALIGFGVINLWKAAFGGLWLKARSHVDVSYDISVEKNSFSLEMPEPAKSIFEACDDPVLTNKMVKTYFRYEDENNITHEQSMPFRFMPSSHSDYGVSCSWNELNMFNINYFFRLDIPKVKYVDSSGFAIIEDPKLKYYQVRSELEEYFLKLYSVKDEDDLEHIVTLIGSEEHIVDGEFGDDSKTIYDWDGNIITLYDEYFKFNDSANAEGTSESFSGDSELTRNHREYLRVTVSLANGFSSYETNYEELYDDMPAPEAPEDIQYGNIDWSDEDDESDLNWDDSDYDDSSGDTQEYIVRDPASTITIDDVIDNENAKHGVR